MFEKLIVVKHLRLFCHDHIVDWLKTEVTSLGLAYLFLGQRCDIGPYFDWCPGSLRQQLCLAGSFHADIPPSNFINRLAYRQQTVILKNGGFFCA